MIEIRYKDNFEVAEAVGKSLADVRRDYKERFDIPEKTIIKLNDRKVKSSQESDIKLRDSDEIRFVTERGGKGALLAGAMLLALALTGGVFAFGFLNSSVQLIGVVRSQTDFATVTPASSINQPTWNVFGNFKGTIGSGKIFNVSALGTTANYTGDLTVTVSLANADELVKVYRVLNLFIVADNSTGGHWDINDNGGYNAADDYALLTLNNGSVDLYINQTYGADTYDIKVDHGFYVSNIYNATRWGSDFEQPILYAQVFQR